METATFFTRPSCVVLVVTIAILVTATSAQVARDGGEMRRGLGDTAEALNKRQDSRSSVPKDRQNKFDFGVEKTPYGSAVTGGVSHTTSGGHRFGGSVKHNIGGGTSGQLEYSKSFDNGRGRVGAHVGHDVTTGNTRVGAGVSWTFKRGIRGYSKNPAQRRGHQLRWDHRSPARQ